jgi:serine/threonine-protein kinase
MAAQLEVIEGPDRGRVFPLSEGQTLQIGRGPSSDTRLCDPCVSRLHCQVVAHNGTLVLTDLGSAGGTRVDGTAVDQCRLQGGEVIAIGETRLRVQLESMHESHTVIRKLPEVTPPPRKLPDNVLELTGARLDRFDVGALLARGHSSVVYQAADTRDRQAVALKVLLPEFTCRDADLQRVQRALKAVQPLRHPNLVSVLDHGKTHLFCWIAMELVEGESLRQVIQRIGTANILDWRHALRVAVHVGRALDFAHQQGIIHRNVTPPNILIRKTDNLAKLGDLMLAKALEGEQGEQITRRGELVGDLAYMAPERTYGNAPVDGRSDIYGLGATVYAMLTGKPPCQGATQFETIVQIRQATPCSPRTIQLSVPEPFERTVMRMLAKDPQQRQQSAAELLGELDAIAKAHGLHIA